MAPTSIHAFIRRDSAPVPSLSEFFHRFPATLWALCKIMIFGLFILLAFAAIIFGIVILVMSILTYGPTFVTWMRGRGLKDIVEGSRKNFERLGRIERVDRIWRWLKCRSARCKAEAVDAEELTHLGSHDDEGREGSVGGETLFEGEEDEDGDGQARKKEETELDTEDYMKGEP